MDDKTIAEIRAYLDGDRSFSEGVALYTAYGKNRSLKRTFDKCSDYTREKVVYELCKLIAAPFDGKLATDDGTPVPPLKARLKVPAAAKASQQTAKPNNDDTLKPGKDAPEVMQKVWAVYKEALKRKDRQKGVLAALGDNEEHDKQREILAAEILQLGEAATEARQYLVAYKENGTVPELSMPQTSNTDLQLPATLPKTLNLKDKGAVQKRLTTVKANKSRDAAKDKDVLRWELEIEFLEKVLDGTIQP